MAVFFGGLPESTIWADLGGYFFNSLRQVLRSTLPKNNMTMEKKHI